MLAFLARLIGRRPWVAPPLVALGHVAFFLLLLWSAGPAPVPPIPLVMDLALVDGRQPGGGSPRGDPAPDAPASTGDGEAAPVASEAAPPPPPPAEPARAPDPMSDVPAEEPEPEPREDIANDPDVVAMVEALTGVKAEAVERRPLVSIDAVLAETLSAANVAIEGAGGCDLGRRVQQRLQDDPAVVAALGALPREGQSVANAVLLWDGEWVASSIAEAEPLLIPARRAVFQVVGAAPEPCRDGLVDGPRFLVIEGERTTHVVVLGSDRWRWGDIALANPDPPPAAPRRERRRWWPWGS